MQRLSLLLLPLALVAFGCESDPSTTLGSDSDDSDGSDSDASDGSDGGDGGGANGGNGPGIDPALADREVSYTEALRTAYLKLARRLPTLEQIKRVDGAEDQKAAYTEELDVLLASPAFSGRMVKFWRDTMRMGGADLDTAPVFAAKLMAEGRPFTELFTAASGNCPTFDGASGDRKSVV